jgi:aspartate aminotransferase
VQELVFGTSSRVLASRRVTSAQTLGGTGGLRVAADLLAETSPGSRVWLSEPTWPNHPNVFRAAGLETRVYPYFDARHHRLDFDALEAGLKEVSAGDVVVLHACCHNPTGADLTPAQWRRVGELARERGFLPLLDFAYQGFGHGVEEDAAGVRALADLVPELIVCSSMSKNFGLYNERVGALHLLTTSAERAEIAGSQVKRVIRANYSNPPAHGSAIVAAILADRELRELWLRELGAMRERIHSVRLRLAALLAARGASRDFSFIAEQQGMFSFTGLSREQVIQLREKFGIYAVESGRINVAGIRDDALERLADAVIAVL